MVDQVEVHQDADGRMWLTETMKRLTGVYGDEPIRTEVLPYRGGSLIAVEADGGEHTVLSFSGDDGHGRARFLHMSGRSVSRVPGA